MIYLFILLLLLFGTYVYDYVGKNKYKFESYYIILILLILVAGFRYRIGVDSIRYEFQYYYIPTIFSLSVDDFLDSKYDPLYLLFTSISRTISEEFWVMQFLHATLVNVIFFRFIKKNTKNIFFAALLYYCFLYISFTCEFMRESFAVSMFLLGYEYLKRNKLIIFSVFCVLAYLFHTSAILLLLLPVFKLFGIWRGIRVNLYSIVFLLCILLLGYMIQEQLFEFLLTLDISERFLEKAEDYADSDLATSTFSVFGILSALIRYLIFPFIACLWLKRRKELPIDLEVLVNLCFVFVVLSIPITLFYRYNNYFFPFAILVLSQVVFTNRAYITSKLYIPFRGFIVWFFLLSPMLLIQIYGYNSPVKGSIVYKEYMRYYPYSSIFTKEMNQNREKLFMYYNVSY